MKLAASNVDLRGMGTGATVVTVVFEPVKHQIRNCKYTMLTTVLQILVLDTLY